MPVDWSSINPSKGVRLTRPREIYASLNGRKWPRLRPEQNEVLEAWFDNRRADSDVVIKQNTGGGKTLVGLLIAQSSLNEGVGPAVYLVPDKFLIEQVVAEAEAARIPVATEVADERFRASQATLVTTFHKLMNGRSTFGVRGVKRVTAIGTVIVDDAHAALAASTNLFTASIPADCYGFDELLKLFESELRTQSPKALADLQAGDYSKPLRVPPMAVFAKAQQALTIVQKYATDNALNSLFFSWPYVADHLNIATVTFTRRAVEIRTPCPNVDLIPAFTEARRRVYLTATLADEGVLVTELNANPETISRPITPGQASDLGDRMILAPLSINPHLTETAVYQLARNFADGDRNQDGQVDAEPVNVVVLVPSDVAASRWKPYANQLLHVTDMRPVINQLRSTHVGIVVLVNKYDGVDLPDDACRLLVVDGVPSPLAPHEQRESAALTGSMTFKTRFVQRLEQGMGRGIRDVEDYCAVLVMTNEAALTLRDASMRGLYSPATRAQIELSNQVAEQIEAMGMNELRDLLSLFLERGNQWRDRSLEAVADVKYESTGSVSTLTTARRKAFDKYLAGDPDGAVQVLRKGIDSISDKATKGWYLEELAAYEQLVDATKSQKTLAAAREMNQSVLKPAVPPSRRPARGFVAQGAAAVECLKQYSDAATLRLSFGALFDNVVWGVDDTADLAEEQIRLLGLHLGFDSTRPEKEDADGGPDNRWVLGASADAVIELKTEVSRPDPAISKSEAEQLVHSKVWDEERFGHITLRTLVMLHPSVTLSSHAHLPDGARVMTVSDFESLRTDVLAFADELAASTDWSDATFVGAALRRHNLSAETVFPRHTSKPMRPSR